MSNAGTTAIPGKQCAHCGKNLSILAGPSLLYFCSDHWWASNARERVKLNALYRNRHCVKAQVAKMVRLLEEKK